MARPLSWLPRLAEIRRSVEGSLREQYDRAAIERLFQIQPRAAGKLMAMLPRVQAPGRAKLVDRETLTKFLEVLQTAEDIPGAMRETRAAKPKTRRGYRVRIRPDGDLLVALGPLPEQVAITMERGRVELRFCTIVDLVEALFAVAATILRDEEGFEREFCGVAPEIAATRERLQQQRQEMEALEQDLDARLRGWLSEKRGYPSGAQTREQLRREAEAFSAAWMPTRNCEDGEQRGTRADGMGSGVPHSPPVPYLNRESGLFKLETRKNAGFVAYKAPLGESVTPAAHGLKYCFLGSFQVATLNYRHLAENRPISAIV